jgi:hypothetical protein
MSQYHVRVKRDVSRDSLQAAVKVGPLWSRFVNARFLDCLRIDPKLHENLGNTVGKLLVSLASLLLSLIVLIFFVNRVCTDLFELYCRNCF